MPRNPLPSLESQARSLADGAITSVELTEVYVQSARDPTLHSAVRQCFAAYDQVAAAILGKLGIADPARLAPHVVALVAGSQLRRLASGATQTEGIGAGLLLLLAGSAGQQPPPRTHSRA